MLSCVPALKQDFYTRLLRQARTQVRHEPQPLRLRFWPQFHSYHAMYAHILSKIVKRLAGRAKPLAEGTSAALCEPQSVVECHHHYQYCSNVLVLVAMPEHE